MTVLELIQFLSTQDPNLEVYTQGYEDGYVDVTTDRIEHIEVCRDFYHDQVEGKNWWSGDRKSIITTDNPEFIVDSSIALPVYPISP